MSGIEQVPSADGPHPYVTIILTGMWGAIELTAS